MSGFDFSVITANWEYLAKGLRYTVQVTLFAMAGGIVLASHKIIRSQPRPALHGHALLTAEIEPRCPDERGVVKALQHAGCLFEMLERIVHRPPPILV